MTICVSFHYAFHCCYCVCLVQVNLQVTRRNKRDATAAANYEPKDSRKWTSHRESQADYTPTHASGGSWISVEQHLGGAVANVGFNAVHAKDAKLWMGITTAVRCRNVESIRTVSVCDWSLGRIDCVTDALFFVVFSVYWSAHSRISTSIGCLHSIEQWTHPCECALIQVKDAYLVQLSDQTTIDRVLQPCKHRKLITVSVSSIFRPGALKLWFLFNSCAGAASLAMQSNWSSDVETQRSISPVRNRM